MVDILATIENLDIIGIIIIAIIIARANTDPG
jgi:hypothetical protein